MSYSLPENEDDRLETLRRLHIYGTSPERKFDQITDATSSALGTKYAAVNLIFADRQWTKAACGIDMEEAPREDSFCARAVASGDMLVIEDLSADEEFSENLFVTEPPHLRFYAGAPLIVEGAALGTLCVFDEEPRSLTKADRELPEDLAGTTAELLEARLQNYQVRYLRAVLEQVDEPVSIVGSDPDNLTDMEVTWVNLSYAMSAPEGETPVGKSPWIFRELEEGSQARSEVQSALRESCRLRGETRTTRPASRSRSGGESRLGNGGDSPNGKSQVPPRRPGEMPHVVAWLLAPVRDEKGQVTHWVTVHRDITDQKIREEELEHKATRDPLTGSRAHPFAANRECRRSAMDACVEQCIFRR
ncbi:GAF domain-containing protein [Salinibacter ruber]|uniref:PAS domain-containing protein n=1 Tax=Salinibacter ruber TaxID=146919 RepID=A0A9X2ZZU3_9BACT|nr:GAF domain-containing protein [Salinibacter ruber]MCS4037782.1 PAS domain-containing protein [Salinibacter ruber]